MGEYWYVFSVAGLMCTALSYLWRRFRFGFAIVGVALCTVGVTLTFVGVTS